MRGDCARLCLVAGRTVEETLEILKKYWGYPSLRPLQGEAIECVLAQRDSVVVLPTGGGKSLCFQVPALQRPGLAIVLSPLISLMKDQVDTLVDCGISAAAVNSMSSADERWRIANDARAGRLKLLYLSPERLMTDKMIEFLQGIPLSFVAIDEAHCISDWGHDFRPEYRMLKRLKSLFSGVSVHAFTATATPRVRDDIARELELENPRILVGSFDRPNLVYRVQRRGDRFAQICDVIRRRPNDSGIIYCIRRTDVDEVCAALVREGYSALPYHAGLSDVDRHRNQDAFLNDRARIIVATVAFGMGIDKSDVRYVIHAGAPKSLEHYQQESGRGGRDGLESECWLFYSAADFQTWRKLQSDLPAEAYEIALTMLSGIERFCTGATCRHRSIVEYFGQDFEPENCQACDACLAELQMLEQPLIMGQKILSSIIRQGENFGADYTMQVLVGSTDQRILSNGHDRLTTYGLLREHDRKHIREWIEQLAAQGFCQRSGEFGVLKVTPAGRRLLKGEIEPRLLKPQDKQRKQSAADKISWEGVDRGLFEVLRAWRKDVASTRGVPPFVVFGDTTLRELARVRPSTAAGLLKIQGIGEYKRDEYGDELLAKIAEYCQSQGLTFDVGLAAISSASPPVRNFSDPTGLSPTDSKRHAFQLFAQGKSVERVRGETGRAISTVWGYLDEFIQANGICDPDPWVDEATFQRICESARQVGADRLKPIFDACQGTIEYPQIRVALACLANRPPEPVT